MIAFEQLDYLKWFSWVKWKLSKNYGLADIGQRHTAEVLFSPAWRIWTLGGQYFRDGTWSRISPTIAFRGCHGVFMSWVYPLRALVLEIQSPFWWCEEGVGLNRGDVSWEVLSLETCPHKGLMQFSWDPSLSLASCLIPWHTVLSDRHLPWFDATEEVFLKTAPCHLDLPACKMEN